MLRLFKALCTIRTLRFCLSLLRYDVKHTLWRIRNHFKPEGEKCIIIPIWPCYNGHSHIYKLGVWFCEVYDYSAQVFKGTEGYA